VGAAEREKVEEGNGKRKGTAGVGRPKIKSASEVVAPTPKRAERRKWRRNTSRETRERQWLSIRGWLWLRLRSSEGHTEAIDRLDKHLISID